jgi:hypothetical protein
VVSEASYQAVQRALGEHGVGEEAHHVIFRGRTYRPLRRPDGAGVAPPPDGDETTGRTRRGRREQLPS